MANRNRTNPVQFYLSDDEQYILNTKFIISRYIVKFLYIFALYWRFSRLFTLKSIKKALSAFYSQKCNLYTCKLSIQVTIPSFLLLQKVIHTIHYEVVLPLKFPRIPYAPNHHIL